MAHTTPPANRETLRNRIAAALTAEHYRRADARIIASPEEHCAAMADAVLAVLPSAADWDALVREADSLLRDGTALHARAEELDTQLAALRRQVPEPAARAAVLREADWIVERCPDHGCVEPSTEVCHCEIADRLRRMADETATETPETPTVAWHILTHQRGTWRPWLAPRDTHTDAREDYDRCVSDNGHRWAFRLVRETSTFTVESEHQPAGARQDGAEEMATDGCTPACDHTPGIRGLLEHVGIDTAGRDIKVGDTVVDACTAEPEAGARQDGAQQS